MNPIAGQTQEILRVEDAAPYVAYVNKPGMSHARKKRMELWLRYLKMNTLYE